MLLARVNLVAVGEADVVGGTIGVLSIGAEEDGTRALDVLEHDGENAVVQAARIIQRGRELLQALDRLLADFHKEVALERIVPVKRARGDVRRLRDVAQGRGLVALGQEQIGRHLEDALLGFRTAYVLAGRHRCAPLNRRRALTPRPPLAFFLKLEC